MNHSTGTSNSSPGSAASTALALAALAFFLQPSPVLHGKDIEPGTAAQTAAHAGRLSDAFRNATGVVLPSVVSITAEKKFPSLDALRGRPSPIPDEFRRFFGDEFGRFFEQPIPEARGFQRGFGSGVIVAPSGYILTNSHVVSGADDIEVRLHDESTYSATIVGSDSKTEVAVIKIEADNLPVAKLADSDKVQVCDWVLAIGGPYGLRNTITAGIVSAKERDTVGIADYESFIQTDAAINPGNSGGPLINMRGEVIGINTAIATRTGANMGVGFSIPSNMARPIMDALIKNGRVDRGFLGALIQNLTPELAQSFGYEDKDGVLISDVTKGGPADKAKLKAGDIVTRIDGAQMGSASQLRNTVAETPPGTKVELEFFRSGRNRSAQVVLGHLDDSATVTGSPAGSAAASELGLVVGPLTPELAGQAGVDTGQPGVAIISVVPGGLAERAGLRPNEIIVSINGEPIADTKDFHEQLGKQDLEAGIRLQVLSEGLKRFLFIRTR